MVHAEGTYQHGRPVGRRIWRDPDGETLRSITYPWSAVATSYEDGVATGRTTLSDPDAIARAESDSSLPTRTLRPEPPRIQVGCALFPELGGGSNWRKL